MSRFRRLIREIHRRSLWQVLGIYAASAWVVYQVVLSLYEGIGLPDWVPLTALVLLLVLLPFVLATAVVQEGAPPAESGAGGDGASESGPGAPPDGPARASDQRASPPPADRRATLFTWSRMVTAGVLGFALLGIAASGFMGMRALGIGPAATLVSAGVLEEREPVLLADFGSPSGDSVLAGAVTAALRVDLESSSIVSLVQASQVQEALRRMLREPGSPVTEAVASEIALREGIRAVLIGDVTAAGDQYVLTARLVSPDGRALTSVRQTASSDAVIEAADRLSASLRERLGESFKSIRAGEPLAEVTTASLDALRKYSQGVRAFDAEPDTRKAIGLLGEAVALDSAFAMAWRKLGISYQNVDRDSMRAALEQAYRHRDRLTDRERYVMEGTYYDVIQSDTARAMLAYETLLDLHPDEPTALHNLARLHSLRMDLERAAALYARKIEVDPYSATSYRNQAHVLAQLGRFEAVDSLLARYAERYPDHYHVPHFRGALAAARFDYAAAADLFDRAYEQSDGESGLWGRMGVRFVQGQHAAALRDYRESLRVTGQVGEEALAQETMTGLLLDLFHRNDPAAARARIARHFTEERLGAVPPEERPYANMALAHVLTGQIEQAERVLERWRQIRPEDFDPPVGQARVVPLEIAAARGESAELIAHNRAAAEDRCLDCWVHLGRSYEAAGMADSAIVAYETYIEPPHPPLFRVNMDQWWLPSTLQRLAALHEEAGDTEAAAGYYARFIEIWKDADPELQPRVEAARSALARLTGEGRG